MKDTSSSLKKTEDFVKQAFMQNPHYSFNDWTVMYNHSVTVKDIALKIANDIDCDKQTVAIGALLHDIGKIYKIDLDILHTKHQLFNLPVCEEFIESLDLSQDKLEKLKQLISYTSDSTEMDIIKDADAIALYKDKRLYMLTIKWAKENNLNWVIKRKLKKYQILHFNSSKAIAKPYFIQMKKDWEKYLGRSL